MLNFSLTRFPHQAAAKKMKEKQKESREEIEM
jgi:hypothetical protein